MVITYNGEKQKLSRDEICKHIRLKKRREQAAIRRSKLNIEQIVYVAMAKSINDQKRRRCRTQAKIKQDALDLKVRNQIQHQNRNFEENIKYMMNRNIMAKRRRLNRTIRKIKKDVLYEEQKHINSSMETRELKRKSLMSRHERITTNYISVMVSGVVIALSLPYKKMCSKPNNKPKPIQKSVHSLPWSLCQTKNGINIIVSGALFFGIPLPYIIDRLENGIELIIALDHDIVSSDGAFIRYYSTLRTSVHPEVVHESLISNGLSRRFLVDMFGRNYTMTQLHHVGNPHLPGYYKKFENKKINESSCYHLTHAYHHDENKILVATSKNRTELIFIPSIFTITMNLTSNLSKDEKEKVDDLKYACRSTKTLLAFKLNDKYSILKACQIIGKTKSMFHSCVPHLRFATHCCKNCSQIHKFPNKRYKEYNKSSKVVKQYGSVKLVHTKVVPGSAKESFLSILIPLTKMLECILRNLPDGLFENKLSSIKSLYDTSCSYISLNMYWGSSTHNHLPKVYYIRKRVGEKGKKKDIYTSHPIGANHEGFHLHKDKNNWGFGAVLIFGSEIEGFDQRYVTLALRLPCPGWSVVFGDFRNLLHSVSKSNNSNGLRFSLVIANHQSTVKGVNEHGQIVFNEDGVHTVI